MKRLLFTIYLLLYFRYAQYDVSGYWLSLVAGHFVEPDGLLIDTHGAEVIDPVWSLLETAYQQIGNVPTCLERDFNMPDLNALSAEVRQIAHLQSALDKPKRKIA